MTNVEINPNLEYILAGDISVSMTTNDVNCGNDTRYNYMLEKFKSFIKTAEDFDEHGGATVLLFGENVKTFEDVKLDDINTKLNSVVFEGFTNLHLAIDTAFDLHLAKKRERAEKGQLHPGTVLIVFTDGEPTNRMAVERSVIRIANTIDRADEFSIILLTVGSRSKEMQQYLDGLHEKLESSLNRDFDILHIAKLEETSFLGTLKLKDHG